MNPINSSIRQNFLSVQERINTAAERSGRNPEEITLVTVTKGFGVPEIVQAVEAGANAIGENRAREAADKFEALGREISNVPIAWHIIGNLQTNKVKYIIEFADLIHSVDRLSLASEINRRANAIGKIQEVLIEVNISGEDAKAGIGPKDAAEFAGRVAGMKNVRPVGLMAMAPLSDNPEDSRSVFSSLRKLRDAINILPGLEGIVELSMGMTGDFEVGIEEGATIIRVGRAILGKRSNFI